MVFICIELVLWLVNWFEYSCRSSGSFSSQLICTLSGNGKCLKREDISRKGLPTWGFQRPGRSPNSPWKDIMVQLMKLWQSVCIGVRFSYISTDLSWLKDLLHPTTVRSSFQTDISFFKTALFICLILIILRLFNLSYD